MPPQNRHHTPMTPDNKVALITSVTGQDGASLFNTDRIDHLYQDPHVDHQRFKLHYGDLTDSTNLIRIIQQVQPDEIYNLAAMSHVAVSFETPEYTANTDGIGTLRLLETPQKETTPFYPRSPYAVAKLYAHWNTVNYREAYGLYACNGILFNHESPLRGETFVTRKITRAMARIALGLQDCLYLGNLGALRDWGHARDYVEAQWLMLQQQEPEDFVIATGVQYSVRQFIEWTAAELGMQLRWKGEGVNEKCYWLNPPPPPPVSLPRPLGEGGGEGCSEGERPIVSIDPRYYRPTEVQTLLGDPSKAKAKLGWSASTKLPQLVAEMVEADYQSARRDSLVKQAGFQAYDYNE